MNNRHLVSDKGERDPKVAVERARNTESSFNMTFINYTLNPIEILSYILVSVWSTERFFSCLSKP